jgi:hypothetical protein
LQELFVKKYLVHIELQIRTSGCTGSLSEDSTRQYEFV